MEREMYEIPNPSLEEAMEPGLAYFQELIGGYTVPIAANSQDVRTKWGSAVLIEIGGRLFAATASHCIGKYPLLSLRGDFRLPTEPTPIKSKFKLPEDVMDVGVIELENDQSLRRCSIENICTDIPVVPADETKPERPFYYVCGYPRKEDRIKDGWLVFRQISMGTYPQFVDGDIYKFAYPTIVSERVGDQFIDMDAKTPHGFSGGGLWRFHPPQPGELYSPRSLRLYGIQYEWHDNDRIDKNRRIYCAPIRHWVKLVFDNYPDLREILKRFVDANVPQ